MMGKAAWLLLSTALLLGCAATEEPAPRSTPRSTAVPEGLRTLDRMLIGTGGVPQESPAERQRKCLAKVATSQLCPLPGRATRTIRLRLVLDERFAQRVADWEQRLDKTFTCVNRFFAPAGIHWELVNAEEWTPGPLRGDIRVDRARLAALRPPDLKSMVMGVVVWDKRKIQARRMGTRLASCESGTCAFVAWPSMGMDCLTWSKNLALEVDARLMTGRRWLISTKYLRYFNLRGNTTAMLHQQYKLHPRNLAALKLARATRYTPQGMLLPNDCYKRLRQLDRCYFSGDPLAVARVRACKRGKASACRLLGNYYARGHGVEKNPVTAAGCYRTACTGGDMQGCATLARLYAAGKGVVLDLVRAAGLLRRACTGGHMGACVKLAGAYRNGKGVARDLRQAIALVEKACRARFFRGCNVLASMISHGQGAAKDQARAARLFRISCDSGDLRGCYSLAMMVDKGQGVKKDRRASGALLQEGCNRGDAKSCYALGDFFWTGHEGLPKDRARSASLFARACEAGYNRACFASASLYRSGDGIAKDLSKAHNFARRSCLANYCSGCFLLAMMHLAGQTSGFLTDDAYRSMGKCCEGGNGDCCQTLARMQWRGRGMVRDRAAAVENFRRGCKHNTAGSCYELGEILFDGLGGIAQDAAGGREMMQRSCKSSYKKACSWLRGKGGG